MSQKITIKKSKVKKSTFSQSQISGGQSAPDELRGQILELTKKLDLALKTLADTAGEDADDLINDGETLKKEAERKKPRKQWWELSSAGLKEAAEALGSISKPVVKIVDDLVSLLERYGG